MCHNRPLGNAIPGQIKVVPRIMPYQPSSGTGDVSGWQKKA